MNGDKNGVSFHESFREGNFFYPSDLVKFNTKTTIPLRVSEERWIKLYRVAKLFVLTG